MMDEQFEFAWTRLDLSEGGYQCDPKDAGNWTGGKCGKGVLKGTNRGISAASYPDLDIKNLTGDQIRAIYWSDWWLKGRFGQLPGLRIPAKVFDAAVPQGLTAGVVALQRALRTCGKTVAEDGNIGPQTISAVEQVPQDSLMAALKAEIAAHYRLVAQASPEKGRFLAGWLTRAYRSV